MSFTIQQGPLVLRWELFNAEFESRELKKRKKLRATCADAKHKTNNKMTTCFVILKSYVTPPFRGTCKISAQNDFFSHFARKMCPPMM